VGLDEFYVTNFVLRRPLSKWSQEEARLEVEIRAAHKRKGVLDSHKLFFNRSEPCYVYKCTSEKNIGWFRRMKGRPKRR